MDHVFFFYTAGGIAATLCGAIAGLISYGVRGESCIATRTHHSVAVEHDEQLRSGHGTHQCSA